jgi:hypothetical protein
MSPDPAPHPETRENPDAVAGPSTHVPEQHGSEHGARRRALTWGAGALTFSVLTLGGFALSAPTAPADDVGPATGPAASSAEEGPATPTA